MNLMSDLRMGARCEVLPQQMPHIHHTFEILGLIQERLSLGTSH